MRGIAGRHGSLEGAASPEGTESTDGARSPEDKASAPLLADMAWTTGEGGSHLGHRAGGSSATGTTPQRCTMPRTRPNPLTTWPETRLGTSSSPVLREKRDTPEVVEILHGRMNLDEHLERLAEEGHHPYPRP